MRRLAFAALAAVAIAPAGVATGDHGGCVNCADHSEWPHIDGKLKIARHPTKSRSFKGTRRNDELLGHHGSDVLSGRRGSDVLWGDYDPNNQPPRQVDTFYGGPGKDFVYGSHGVNRVYGGSGNDAISVHYGRGLVDCGPGRDIYHVARSRRKGYRFRRCEKVDYRPEKVRGGGLKPLR
jgi:Ca2+-binding RTX toxin-like protein